MGPVYIHWYSVHTLGQWWGWMKMWNGFTFIMLVLSIFACSSLGCRSTSSFFISPTYRETLLNNNSTLWICLFKRKTDIKKLKYSVKILLCIPETQQRLVYPDRWYTSVLLSWQCLFSESIEVGKLQSAPDRMWVSHNYGGLSLRGICNKNNCVIN